MPCTFRSTCPELTDTAQSVHRSLLSISSTHLQHSFSLPFALSSLLSYRGRDWSPAQPRSLLCTCHCSFSNIQFKGGEAMEKREESVWKSRWRESVHPVVYFSNVPKGQDWTEPKPEARNTIQVSHVSGSNPVTRAATAAFHRLLATVRSRSCLSNSSTPMWAS